MNINPYAAEKLMELQQLELDRASRNAWARFGPSTTMPSLFGRLAAKLTRKTVTKRNAVNPECCAAC